MINNRVPTATGTNTQPITQQAPRADNTQDDLKWPDAFASAARQHHLAHRLDRGAIDTQVAPDGSIWANNL